VERDSIDQRVLVDRSSVAGASARRLAVGIAGSSDVLRGDRPEGREFGGVDLDLSRPLKPELPSIGAT